MTVQEIIFDENLINIRKERAKNKFSSFLHDLAIIDLKDRTSEIGFKHPETLIVGHFAEHWVNKINHNKVHHIKEEEFLKITPNSKDLIISAFHLHSVNDPIAKLVQIRHGLKKNGLFIGYAFGEKSLYELRRSFEHAEIKSFGGVSPRVHPMVDTATYGTLLKRSGFNFCVSDKIHLEIKYENPLDLIFDLRCMGETNCLIERNKRILTKNFLSDVINFYKKNFCAKKIGSKYIATFDIVCLTGWISKPKVII